MNESEAKLIEAQLEKLHDHMTYILYMLAGLLFIVAAVMIVAFEGNMAIAVIAGACGATWMVVGALLKMR